MNRTLCRLFTLCEDIKPLELLEGLINHLLCTTIKNTTANKIDWLLDTNWLKVICSAIKIIENRGLTEDLPGV